MNLEKYQKCINFLVNKNCHNIKHSNSNFLNHLIGTFNILKKWKQDDDVCFAGMFHNVYGNEFFNANLNVNREEIKQLIGEKAEDLVFKYVSKNKNFNSEYEKEHLAIISTANNFEQSPLFSVEDNLYNKEMSEKISNYFWDIPYTFDASNVTYISKKWNYYLNFKNEIESNFLKINDLLLNKYNLYKLVKLNRAYVSSNTYGYLGEYHVDDDAKEFNEVFTIMYYLNSEWKRDFCGETSFILNKNTMTNVLPEPARAVIFDGYIEHGPKPLSKIYVGLRMVLTFKYKLIGK